MASGDIIRVGALANGGNADTVDGLHGNDLVRNNVYSADDISVRIGESALLQCSTPGNGWYSGASGWQHLINVQHNNGANNYALQIAGSFFDQNLYFRKTANVGTTAWSKISVDGHTHTAINGYTASATPATTEKKDLIAMVNECFTNASNGKTSIANAVTGKGVSASSSDTFSALATKIGQIKLGQGNAVESQVLSGATFANADGVLRTGAMKNVNAQLQGSAASDAFTSNYITGSASNDYVGRLDFTNTVGYVNGPTIHIANLIPSNIKAGVKIGGSNGYIGGTFTADATATAADIAIGKTAYVNGSKVTGTGSTGSAGVANYMFSRSSGTSTILTISQLPFPVRQFIAHVTDQSGRDFYLTYIYSVADYVTIVNTSSNSVSMCTFGATSGWSMTDTQMQMDLGACGDWWTIELTICKQ